MIWLKLIIIKTLFLECFTQDELTPRISTIESTNKKNLLNSVLDSIINALHPGDISETPTNDTVSNSIWQLNQQNNLSSTVGLFQDSSTSTEDIQVVSASTLAQEKETEYPSEGFFDPYANLSYRHNLGPIFQKLFKQPSSQNTIPEDNSTQRAKKHKHENSFMHRKSSSSFSTSRPKETTHQLSSQYTIKPSSPWLKTKIDKITPNYEMKTSDAETGDDSSKNLLDNSKITLEPEQINSLQDQSNKSSIKEMLTGNNKVNFDEVNKSTANSAQYDMIDEFVPVKPDLSVIFNSDRKPDFDIDSVLSKLSRLISTTTIASTQISEINSNTESGTMLKQNEITLPTPSSTRKDVDDSEKPASIGSSKSTKPPIIGPINQQKAHSDEHGQSLKLSSQNRDGYDLITLSKIEAPLHTILNNTNNVIKANQITKEPDTEETKKNSLPRPVNYIKYAGTITTQKSETFEAPSDRIDQENSDLINNSTPYRQISEVPTTEGIYVEKSPRRTTTRPLLLPTLSIMRNTKKAKLPYWLTNILSPILPRTTSRPLHRSTKSIFNIITESDPDNSRDGPKLGDKQMEGSTTPKHNDGYVVGHNSGQSLTGIGNTNGQGGISIGLNSGFGKRPSRKPLLARPLVVYHTKPVRVEFEEDQGE